ncbi:MazG nucleotide pyrophosphohydrolase domain-containing protein [Corynebacterium variabile]|nr:MazG nucleotide pyrophosphohydrolase domain-containing protein [Corynebacterium variabile]
MSVVLLDPRFPAMLPVDAVPLLGGDVSYTEEVPVRIRWVIADLGGHTVEEAEVLVTTDPENEQVVARLNRREELVRSPSLLVAMEPDRELESAATAAAPQVPETPEIDVSGGGYVDGEIVGTDEHTVAVAGMRRTTRTEVPGSVIDELEDAVALMARALRQGEWEQEQTHASLLTYLREETEELAEVIEAGDAAGSYDEQELCKELSDLLLQVLFHAEIANRRGIFDIGHVAGAFVAKMRNRAPYLFEEAERPVSREEQDRLWAEGRVREGKEPYKREEPEAEEFPAVTGLQAAASPLAAAEEVIAVARAAGLPDTEIPTDIRYPMVGLESDKPGDAENRLMTAVSTFRRQLEQRQAGWGEGALG